MQISHLVRSPNVGGHQQPLSKGHVNSPSQKGHLKNCQVHGDVIFNFQNAKNNYMSTGSVDTYFSYILINTITHMYIYIYILQIQIYQTFQAHTNAYPLRIKFVPYMSFHHHGPPAETAGCICLERREENTQHLSHLNLVVQFCSCIRASRIR